MDMPITTIAVAKHLLFMIASLLDRLVTGFGVIVMPRGLYPASTFFAVAKQLPARSRRSVHMTKEW